MPSFARLGRRETAEVSSSTCVSEIGIVLSDFGRLAFVFNNLICFLHPNICATSFESSRPSWSLTPFQSGAVSGPSEIWDLESPMMQQHALFFSNMGGSLGAYSCFQRLGRLCSCIFAKWHGRPGDESWSRYHAKQQRVGETPNDERRPKCSILNP